MLDYSDGREAKDEREPRINKTIEILDDENDIRV